MSLVVPAAFGAALLAMAGAVFGVSMARIMWADDLKNAQQIDEIRSRTQSHMEGQIKAQQKTIDILKRWLGE